MEGRIDASEVRRLVVDLRAHNVLALGLVSKALRKTAFDVVASAQQLVPVDTGATRDSIFASGPGGSPLGVGSFEAEIGPTTDYAPHLEYGTSRMSPRPFMGPALDRHASELEEAMALIAERFA